MKLGKESVVHKQFIIFKFDKVCVCTCNEEKRKQKTRGSRSAGARTIFRFYTVQFRKIVEKYKVGRQ